MKRTGTLTVPYTFCLFCAAIGLVLLMVGIVAALALRDARAAEPALAADLLHDAIHPVARAMSECVDGAALQLQSAQNWAANGLLPSANAARWPEVLLPALAALDAVREVFVVKDNGMRFHAVREGQIWVGETYDPADPDAALLGARWNDTGTRLESARSRETVADPRLNSWYAKALSASTEPRTPMITEHQETALTLAAPLHFSGKMQGCVAFVLDTSAVLRAAKAGGKVELMLDPGGQRLSQIQDSQALALLQEHALPGHANGAFAQLYPDDTPSESTWYAASAYVFRNSPDQWWIIGRVERAALPRPALPLGEYLAWALGTGLSGALLLSLLFGNRMTRPLRQVAARARSIHLIDEHYRPWPRSRFTEVNVLTTALEDIYETAVEHMDYHDAPLVAWAEPEEAAAEGMIDAEAVRHVFQFPRGKGDTPETPEAADTVIDVAAGTEAMALPEPIPAAQLQLLHGTRKEVRRLQSQLAGACEELRTADNHYQQDQARMKRQRQCLRNLERLILAEGGASPRMLAQIQEVLGASRVSIWTAGTEVGHFHLSGVAGALPAVAVPLSAPFSFMALIQSESLVTVQEPAKDPRLTALSSHPFFPNNDEPRLLAPIKMAGKLVAFMVADRPGGMGRWKGDEELFVMGVAHACAGVLWRQLRQRTSAPTALGTTPFVMPGAVPSRPGNGAKKHASGAPRHPAGGLPTLYWEIDRAGCIKSIEGDVESLYGRSAEQLIGQPITFLSDAAQGGRDMERLAELLAGQRCKGYETCHVTADGAALHLTVRAKVWRDAGDRIIGARGTLELVPAAIAS